MKTSLIQFTTTDGLELHGLLFEPESKSAVAVLHVHGLAGNFYENRFVRDLAEAACANNASFFSFNNRGHDYMADVPSVAEENSESIRLGGAYETFRECIADIEGAMRYLRGVGYSSYILEGHSTGANKVAYYQAIRRDPSVRGIALLSPCDDVALQASSVEGRQTELVDLARDMINRGDGRKLMPDGSFYSYPMSAATFLDYFRIEADQDIFPYRDKAVEFKIVGSLKCPLFATFGGEGDYTFDSPDETLQILRSKATAAKSFRWHVVAGCGHAYKNGEHLLSMYFSDWLRDIL